MTAEIKGEYVFKSRKYSGIRNRTKVPMIGPIKLSIPPMSTYITSHRVAKKLKLFEESV
jgi:putative N-acetylmannosamine-6-phosphate epimerase